MADPHLREALEEQIHKAARQVLRCQRDCEFELAEYYRGREQAFREARALAEEKQEGAERIESCRCGHHIAVRHEATTAKCPRCGRNNLIDWLAPPKQEGARGLQYPCTCPTEGSSNCRVHRAGQEGETRPVYIDLHGTSYAGETAKQEGDFPPDKILNPLSADPKERAAAKQEGPAEQRRPIWYRGMDGRDYATICACNMCPALYLGPWRQDSPCPECGSTVEPNQEQVVPAPAEPDGSTRTR